MRIEILSGYRFVDMISDGVDVAIRLGELADSNYRAIRISQYSKRLVVNPDFVLRAALPADILDAADLPFVGLSVLPQPTRCKV